jgi:hypothetical protein
MLFHKYVLEDLSVGSGSIIGKDNIKEFFNHIVGGMTPGRVKRLERYKSYG